MKRYECRPIPRLYARRAQPSFLVGLSCTVLVALVGVTAVRSQFGMLLLAAPLAFLAVPLLLGPLLRRRRARKLRYVVTEDGLAVVDEVQGPLATFGFEALEHGRIRRRDDGTGDLDLFDPRDALGFREAADSGFYGVPDIERFLEEARAAQHGDDVPVAERELQAAA